MAIRNIVSFATGTLAEVYEPIAFNAVIDTQYVRPGSAYSCATSSLGTDVSGFVVRAARNNNLGTNFNLTNAWCSFYVYFLFFPSQPEVFAQAVTSTNGLKLELRISSDGLLRAYNASASLVATGSIPLQEGQWYKLSLRVGTGSTASYEVRVNDQTELSGSAAQGTANFNALRLGKYINRNGQGAGFAFSDILVDDTEFLMGEYRISAFMPGGDAGGTWTGGYTDLLPFSLTDDTNFVTSSTNLATEDFSKPSFAANGITDADQVLAVKTMAVARRTAQAVNLLMRRGSSATTVGAVNSAYEALELLDATRPSTSTAWGDKTFLESLTMGVMHNGTTGRPIRVTSMAMIVAYTLGVLPPIIRDPRSFGAVVG